MRLTREWFPLLLLAGLSACTFDPSGVPFSASGPYPDLKGSKDFKPTDAPKPGKDLKRDKPGNPTDSNQPPTKDKFVKPDAAKPPDIKITDLFLIPDATKCPGTLTKCGPACVDINQDTKHCGGCFQPCPGGYLCSKRMCCPFMSTNCGNKCVMTAQNDAHCGGCNKPCTTPKQACTNGHCCDKTERYCAGACVDLKTDSKHCGFCGNSCPTGQVCKSGACCAPSFVNCGGACADLKWDPNHCGICNNKCKPNHGCSGSLCCPAGETNCNGTCYNTSANVKNCGGCGKACSATEACVNGVCGGSGTTTGCATGPDDQTFSGGMRGCKGAVSFAKRADLCSAKFRVCAAKEWVSLRGSTAPTYNYWTDDKLSYYGSDGNCAALIYQSGYHNCSSSSPMRVCSSTKDGLGNVCNWTGCGYYKRKPNDYFGGCNGNLTAGTLCCPK